jgi:hypothetical protein
LLADHREQEHVSREPMSAGEHDALSWHGFGHGESGECRSFVWHRAGQGVRFGA